MSNCDPKLPGSAHRLERLVLGPPYPKSSGAVQTSPKLIKRRRQAASDSQHRYFLDA